MPLLVEPALPVGTLGGMPQPRLVVGDGLSMRPWEARDAAAVRLAYDCPEIQRWHVRRFDTVEEAGEWVAQWSDRWNAETAASWAVVDADNRPLGQAGLRDISLDEGSAALSYWVTPSARGRAIATRSVAALSAWAFGQIGFHRLTIDHSVANPASCRVATRSGYQLEGTLRQAIKHADGWHNWHIHSRLHTDVPSAT